MTQKYFHLIYLWYHDTITIMYINEKQTFTLGYVLMLKKNKSRIWQHITGCQTRKRRIWE